MDEALIEAVAKAICSTCDEDPMHAGDCRGNEYRWEDYREPAIAAIREVEAAPQVAGYTSEDLDDQSRAFTIYRNHHDAAFEAECTGRTVTTVYRKRKT